MPDVCCVAGCPNVGTHKGVIRYYSFPQAIDNKGDDIKRLSSLRRERWIASVKAKKPDWEPNKLSTICSFHFVSGHKATLSDVNSPDWVPTLFMGPSMDNKLQESGTITLIKGLVAKKQQEICAAKMTIEKPTAICMLSSTHERWTKVKKQLAFKNDDGVASYLLSLFEAGVHKVQETTHGMPTVNKQIHHKVNEKTTNAPSASISMATTDGNEVVDVPFTQPIRVKKEIEDDEELHPEVTKQQRMTLQVIQPRVASQTPQVVVMSSSPSSIDNDDDDKVKVVLCPPNASSAGSSKPGPLYINDATLAKYLLNLCKAGINPSHKTLPSTSVSMATSNDNDVVDVPFAQPIGVKREKESQSSEPKITSAAQLIKLKITSRPSDVAFSPTSNIALSPTPNKVSTLAPNIASPSFICTDKDDGKVRTAWYPPNVPALSVESSTTVDSKKSAHTCCHKRFASPELVEEHKLEVHGSVDKYKCRHCCLTYKTRSGLTRHNVNDHPGPASRPYPCATCDKSFAIMKSLIHHQKTHVEGTIYECDFCNRTFKDRTQFHKHKAELHIKNEDGTDTYVGVKCRKCGYVYKNKSALSTHEMSSCEGWAKLANVMSCMPCKLKFEHFLQLKEHLKEIHQKDIADTEDDGQELSVCGCGKVLRGKNDAIVHICPQPRQVCLHCNKTFKHYWSLQQHVTCKHSANKPEFKCKQCGRSYNRKNHMKAHERIHTEGQTKYKCKQCPKEYTSKQVLMHHELNKHKGVRSLCSVCGKGFTTPTILNHHMKIHRKEISHRCSYCNKGFYDSYSMRCHMNSHTGTKNLKCNYCDKMFRYSSTRSLHHRTQHTAEHCTNKRKTALLAVATPEEEMDNVMDNPQEASQDLSEVWEILNKDLDEEGD